jgi:hypothetical protein
MVVSQSERRTLRGVMDAYSLTRDQRVMAIILHSIRGLETALEFARQVNDPGRLAKASEETV